MGTTFSLVTYAERHQESNQWELRNQVVEGSVYHWLVHHIEKMQGRGQFVFLGETPIEVPEDNAITLKRYIERVGFLSVEIPMSTG